jgi:dihydromethanopterin reductase
MGVADIRAMCAIGLRGQLGLRGGLPWEGAKGAVFRRDVQRFWEATRGHVLLAGPETVRSIPASERADRTIVEVRSHTRPEDALAPFAGRVVYIGGGPPVWTAYAHLIQYWDITRLPYDGEADRWFDPAWLVAGGVAGRQGRAHIGEHEKGRD